MESVEDTRGQHCATNVDGRDGRGERLGARVEIEHLTGVRGFRETSGSQACVSTLVMVLWNAALSEAILSTDDPIVRVDQLHALHDARPALCRARNISCAPTEAATSLLDDVDTYRALVKAKRTEIESVAANLGAAAAGEREFTAGAIIKVLRALRAQQAETTRTLERLAPLAAEYRAAAIRRFLKKRKRPEARRISTSRERTVDSSRQHNRDATATTTENGSNGSEEKRSLSSRAQATDE